MANAQKAAFLKSARIKTSRTVISDGEVKRKDNPIQANYRLPTETVNWFRDNVRGNAGYAISEILKGGIKIINSKLNTDDFDMDDYADLIENLLEE